MFTQKTKSLVQKFTVLLMLFSFVQSSWAGLELKFSNENASAEKIAYSNFDTPANYYDIDDGEPNILNINNYVKKDNNSIINLNENVQITNSKSKINLSLRDSDVKQVLRMFAQKAGMNVIFHNSVDGKVTLDLVNVTLNDAFLLVLRSAELTYVLDGKNIIVASIKDGSKLSFTKQNLNIIPIKYERAQNIADFLNNNIFGSNITGLSNDKIVTSNPATNELLLFGTQNDYEVAKKIAQKLDRKPMINTFKVNHTTPKEMAMLICSTFVEVNKKVSTEDEDDLAEDDDDDETDDEEEIRKVKLGSGIVACRATESVARGDSDQQGPVGGMSTDNAIKMFGSSPLAVVYFPELGTININGGSYEQVKMIKEFIEQNDKKQPMAYVEMTVVELNETGSKEFANEWSLWTPFISLSFDTANGLATDANHPTFFMGRSYTTSETTTGDDGQTTTTRYTVDKYKGDSTLVYRLKYLVQNGKGRVLTNPKIMVTNGQKSVIDMTADYVKTVKSEMLTTIDNAGISRTYEVGDDEGLKIELLPFISPDGYVSMNIKPEFATIKERIYAPGQAGVDELQATLLQRRDLSLNNIRIKDGETLVLAGLIKENETQQVTKIPVLGDLPLVGVFFRTSSNQKTKEELVIMITPHIVYSSEDIANIKPIDL